MATPRRVSTRRAVLSFSQLKDMNPNWVDLMVKDYQGIIEDFSFTSDEIDALELRVIDNEDDILALQISVADLQERVTELEYRVFNTVTITDDYTAEEFQMVICRNTTPKTVTLKASPLIDDEIHIKRRGEEITVVGLIDGDNDLIINILNYSLHLVFNGIDWSSI